MYSGASGRDVIDMGRISDEADCLVTGFGELLQWHRGAAGLTQEELAGRSGVSVRAITAILAR